MIEVNKMTKKERCWYIIDNVLIQSEADDISSYLDELEQQKAELMKIAKEYSYLLLTQQTYDFNNEHDLKRGEEIEELIEKYI